MTQRNRYYEQIAIYQDNWDYYYSLDIYQLENLITRYTFGFLRFTKKYRILARGIGEILAHLRRNPRPQKSDNDIICKTSKIF